MFDIVYIPSYTQGRNTNYTCPITMYFDSPFVSRSNSETSNIYRITNNGAFEIWENCILWKYKYIVFIEMFNSVCGILNKCSFYWSFIVLKIYTNKKLNVYLSIESIRDWPFWHFSYSMSTTSLPIIMWYW